MKQYSKIDMKGNEIINCPSIKGGSAVTTKDITSNVDVGGIPSNTKIDKDTEFTNFVERLLRKAIIPSCTFSSSGSGVHEVGDTVNGSTLTLNIANLSSVTETINSIEFKVAGQTVDTQTFVDGQSKYTFVYSDPISTTMKTTAILTYNNTQKLTYNAEFTFVYASYYGAVDSLTVTDQDILALSKTVKTSKGYTWNNIDLNNQRFCYAYPESMGNLSSIKDANNFEYLGSYTKSTVVVDGQNYNVYVLTDPVSITGAKQIYS